jgi:hypothetical protein
MKPESISIGKTVRVREHHRIAERRSMVGTIVDHFGGDGYMVVEVRFSDRLRWLLWPEDLEETISSPAIVTIAYATDQRRRSQGSSYYERLYGSSLRERPA